MSEEPQGSLVQCLLLKEQRVLYMSVKVKVKVPSLPHLSSLGLLRSKAELSTNIKKRVNVPEHPRYCDGNPLGILSVGFS